VTAADLPPPVRARLRVVFERLVPADEWRALTEAELLAHLDRLADEALNRSEAEAVVAAVERLGLDGVDEVTVDAAIGAMDPDDRDLLVRTAARAYYGRDDATGARMLGWSPAAGGERIGPELRTTSLVQVRDGYDVVVLGAGGGGGVVACVLAEAGARVLLVERGAAAVAPDRDHLRNHRSKAHGLGTTIGDDEPRVLEEDGAARVIDRPWEPGWHAGARVVGGGTRVYQGLAWRFLPDDFRMASRYGVPDGSSLADWPLTYDDLAPHYDWVEWEVGVCGDPAGHRAAGPRDRGYPMPPLPGDAEGERLRAGAQLLGLATGRVPLLLNSVPRDGRPSCGTCGGCVGLPCRTGGRNGTHNTVLPRALAAGATLVTGTRATAITTAAGGVDGVHVVDEASGAGRHVRAGHVVVACGAIETARLLLASRSDRHPGGLGNASDQVGRHLQGHAFASAFGLFGDEVTGGPGPGATIATLDLAHGNALEDGTPLVGGGVVGNELRKLPIVHWQWALPPDAQRWGLAGKAAMRDTYRRTGHLFAQVQEVPRPGNRVALDPEVRDRHGLPAARLAGATHPETVRTAHHVAARAEAWMAASGADRTWIDGIPTGLLAGTHQAGTCRMGADPAMSVTDPDGRVHGHRNLWVADASLHVTNGSVSPALTVMALAHRTALRLLAGR